MKRMIKGMFFLMLFTLLVGCKNTMSPSEKTEEFLNRYIKNDSVIVSELDTYLSKQGLSNEQREKYRSIILEEYATLKYSIKDESIDDDKASVKTIIEVKDLYKASKNAEEYLILHPEEFYTDDAYDKDKFNDYKLDVMAKSDIKIEYQLNIKLSKKDSTWVIDELDNETLEKIHGIYNYENG